MSKRKKLILIGSKGFIGSGIPVYFREFEIIPVRGKFVLSCEMNELVSLLESSELLINLAGYGVFGRWTGKRKRLIWESRIRLTKRLAEGVNLCSCPPSVFMNASAIGIYSGIGTHYEDSQSFSDNYLAAVVLNWEKEAARAASTDTRLVILRIGVVLGLKGGAYPLLRKLAKYSLATWFGRGNQPYSFIYYYDLLKAIRFLYDEEIEGPVNLTCPKPVTFKDFILKLSEKSSSITSWRIPRFIPKLLFGEASILFTEGQFALPGVLEKHGFSFEAPDMETCLDKLEELGTR